MSSSRSALATLLVAAPLIAGCPPTCEATCNKLVGCELTAEVQALECTTACRRELAAYQDDNDTVREEAFDQQRYCLGDATCDEIENAACFDDLLFPFPLSSAGG